MYEVELAGAGPKAVGRQKTQRSKRFYAAVRTMIWYSLILEDMVSGSCLLSHTT
jgi:hypothetical protein